MADIPFEDKLLVVDKILSMTKDELKSIPTVENLIREMGLHDDPNIHHLYDKKDLHYLKQYGMLQRPDQLAPALVFLSSRPIQSYIEIGTFNGTATAFITAYLNVFNRGMKAKTVDIWIRHNPLFEKELQKRFDIEFITGTSESVKGEKCDLCFIDADHSYKAVVADYENVGKYAKICMFHDIVDQFQYTRNDGGSLKFWLELPKIEVDKSFYEIIEGGTMGIGIRL